LAGIAAAQTKKAKKPDRLSGVVKSVDAGSKTIEMHMRKSPNQVRKIMFDDSTKFTLSGKPATAADAKEGQGIVALGKFEGINLKAGQVALTLR
jgi:hypothetical protein